jgi:nitrate reductase NapE component
MQKSLKMKEIAKRSEIITILFIDLHVYEELNCLIND